MLDVRTTDEEATHMCSTSLVALAHSEYVPSFCQLYFRSHLTNIDRAHMCRPLPRPCARRKQGVQHGCMRMHSARGCVCVFSGAIIFHSNKHAFHSNTHEVTSYFFALAVTISVHTSLLGVRESAVKIEKATSS